MASNLVPHLEALANAKSPHKRRMVLRSMPLIRLLIMESDDKIGVGCLSGGVVLMFPMMTVEFWPTSHKWKVRGKPQIYTGIRQLKKCVTSAYKDHERLRRIANCT